MNIWSNTFLNDQKNTGCPIAQVKLSSSGNFNAPLKNSTKPRFLHLHDNRNRSFVRALKYGHITSVTSWTSSTATIQNISSISDTNAATEDIRNHRRMISQSMPFEMRAIKWKFTIYRSVPNLACASGKGLIYAKFAGCWATVTTYWLNEILRMQMLFWRFFCIFFRIEVVWWCL